MEILWGKCKIMYAICHMIYRSSRFLVEKITCLKCTEKSCWFKNIELSKQDCAMIYGKPYQKVKLIKKKIRIHRDIKVRESGKLS